jgi:hypothetical protein
VHTPIDYGATLPISCTRMACIVRVVRSLLRRDIARGWSEETKRRNEADAGEDWGAWCVPAVAPGRAN